MKHAFALAAVVAVGLGTVAATVAVGSAVKEPTVVVDPYEAGLHHAEAVARRGGAAAPSAAAAACDLAAGACSARAGPFDVRLDLGPRPLRTMAALGARALLVRDGAAVDGASVGLAFDMRGMPMGENRRTLAGLGGGRYGGEAVLVRCPSGRRDWTATVSITLPGQASPESVRFDFRVER